MKMRDALVILQGLTFIGLALYFCTHGEARLGAAQGLLAIITWLIYA